MKFLKMAKSAAFVMSLLSLKEIPIANSKVNFEEDQEARLKEVLGDQFEEMVGAMNKEIEDTKKANADNKDLQKAEQDLAEILAETKAMLDQTNLSEKEKKDIMEGKTGATNKEGGKQSFEEMAKEIKAGHQNLNAQIKKLMESAEGDSPEEILTPDKLNMKHSNTHLFASGKKWDSFESRPWNQRLRDGGIQSTDFNSDGRIPLLQDDVEHFVRENPQVIDSLFNDFEELPKEWDSVSGVLDRKASGTILADEITQARAKGFAPKNKFKITPEEGRVFRKKIDITFDGYELQEIENTWVRAWNKSGSHPWKMSFIGFLLSELIKQQKLDSRKAQVNGIFVQTPEGKTGMNVNSQDGLRYLWWVKRDVEKKYRPFEMGYEPTKANIVDYIDDTIERIPEEDREESGMEIQISAEMLTWYRKKAGELYQVHKSNDEGKKEYGLDYPVDHPNYMFQELKDKTKTKFIGITKSKNVQIMDYNTSEKGKFTITHEKRDTHIFADFREGIRFKFVGTKLQAGDPAAFERQLVWSNDQPIFDKSVYVPVFDNETGIVSLHYNHIKVDGDWKTDITKIEDATPGTVVRITGNTSLAAAKNVKDNENLDLTADFDLSNGGTLVLYANNDGTLTELSRTNEAPAAASTEVEFAGDTIDATNGKEFYFTGGADEALASIVHGVDGQKLKVYGTDAVDVELTVNNVEGNIAVTGAAVLAAKADFIELMKVDGVWTEVSRTIA